MKRKIQKRRLYDGLGVPMLLIDVPMTKVRGKWTPDIDYNKLRELVFRALASKPTRLTGNEIKFIRHYLKMTLSAFGQRFDVAHSAVRKWEEFANIPTNMKWPTEKDIRLFVVSNIDKSEKTLRDIYAQLEVVPSKRRKLPEYNVKTETITV